MNEIFKMIKTENQKKTTIDRNVIIIGFFLLLIVFFCLLTTIFQNRKIKQEEGYSRIFYAIHAVKPAVYTDQIKAIRIPGVKLSIIWEILADQNLSKEEIEKRVMKLEEQFSQSRLGNSSQPHQPSSFFGPNPLVDNIELPIVENNPTLNPSNEPTQLIVQGQTATIISTPTILPSFPQNPSSTFTPIPTKTNGIIWYPTYTFTPPPPDTPVPPEPTMTATQTSTFTPTATLVFTLTATETFTPTPVTCNPDENLVIEVFPLVNSEDNPLVVQPLIKFNQSMDSSTFIYGSESPSIALCTKLNESQVSCPTGQIIDAAIEISTTNYFNDTVILRPISPLITDTAYLIYLSERINPHPQCDGFPDPIIEDMVTSFSTVSE